MTSVTTSPVRPEPADGSCPPAAPDPGDPATGGPDDRGVDERGPDGAAAGWGPGPTGGVVDASGGPRCPACAGRAARAVEPGGHERPAVTSPERAAAVLAPVLVGRDREACVAVALDTRHRVLAVDLVSVGSLDHTFMAPREVFRDALLANAAALVVGHNHPSGDPRPSADDVAVTTRLARAGEVVGVELLDHLVVAGSSWESLARHGHC